MAASYDGSIRINTKIDSKSAETGLATLTKSLKSFAAAVGVAFGVAAIVSFSKTCIDLASDLNEVQNVVDTTFGSGASEINDFAKTAATQFGLSELAAKQYTGTMGAMLKSMGFTSDAAADMSVELAGLAGDMASFYNLTSDAAFEKIRSGISGETEPLKQLGINLSEANLEAYALAQGITTSYSALSEQQKALVRYNYLLDVTSDAQGDFAKTSSSWANQVRILSLQFDTLKATLGKAFIAVLTPVLQIINQILGALNSAATVFGNFVAAVTGTAQSVTTATTEAADAVDDQTDSITESGEAAKSASKSLAGFDDLNVLSDTGSAAGTASTDTSDTKAAADDVSETINSGIDDMKVKLEEFFELYQSEIQRVKDGWNSLKDTVSGIWDSLQRQMDNTDLGGAAFQGLMNGLYAVENGMNLLISAAGNLFVALNVPEAVQSALDFLASAFKAVGDIITAVTPGVMAFVDTALVPIAEWIGGKIRDAFAFLAEQLEKVGNWFSDHQEQFTELGEKLGEAAAAIWGIIEPLADAVWESAKAIISGLVDALLAFSGWVLENGETVKEWVIGIGIAFAAWKIVQFLAELQSLCGPEGLGALGTALQLLAEDKLKNVNSALDTFKGGITKTVDEVKKFVTGIWDTISAAGQFLIEIGKQTAALIANAAQWVWSKICMAASTVAQIAMTAATVAWHAICTAATVVTTAFGAAVAFLTSPIGLVVAAVAALIAIIVILVTHWDEVKTAASAAWEWIKGAWAAAAEWFNTNIVTPIANFFGGLWEGIKAAGGTLADWMKNKVIDPIVDLFDGMYNAVIGIIEGLINGYIGIINGFIKGINGVIGIINKIPGVDLPKLGTLSTVTIPRLAQGAVIPPNREFVAVLGDQKSGKNIETPLQTMIDAFKTALSEMEYNGSGDFTVTMPVYLDSEKIYEGQLKVQRRRGTNLAKVGGI